MTCLWREIPPLSAAARTGTYCFLDQVGIRHGAPARSSSVATSLMHCCTIVDVPLKLNPVEQVSGICHALRLDCGLMIIQNPTHDYTSIYALSGSSARLNSVPQHVRRTSPVRALWVMLIWGLGISRRSAKTSSALPELDKANGLRPARRTIGWSGPEERCAGTAWGNSSPSYSHMAELCRMIPCARILSRLSPEPGEGSGEHSVSGHDTVRQP